MTHWHDARAAQVAAMADPERLRLLGLILTDPTGQVTAEHLAGTADPGPIRRHLDALTDVELLSRHGSHYRPTHDALVRFGALAEDRGAAPAHRADHERSLAAITASLSERFAGVLAAETVHDFVMDSYDLLASRATVRRFLPQLTDRFAADRLTALASVDHQGARTRDDVLFVCVRNAGRSQIAAALMRAKVGNDVRIRTAGSAPASRLDPTVQDELARRGVDTLTEFPRPLTSEVVQASGTVVTMGCGDACPVLPGRRYLDWQVDDPVGKSRQDVRRIIADIDWRVDELITEMDHTARP
ncbi:low molecular weight phosphatase family protein [Aeromicrobium sp. CTD01-1L150]|uniref:arsenate-mycothiol transferase ArsC n=1 Tax=Aeromicrobium sp. CTD01-1L150 TaxID=3341830 RepID=UPI0035BF879D